MPASSDGFVTVTADSVWASVKVDVNWGTSTPKPWRTTVTRTNPDGTVVTVRSGDLAYSPGGAVFVYDHWAPIEGTLKYQAFGYSTTGALLFTSTLATLVLPAATSTAWLKSVSNPSLSRKVTINGPLDEQWSTPTVTFHIPGRSAPVVWQDVQSSTTGILRLSASSQADYVALRALSGAGVLLLQASSADYSLPGDIYLTSPTAVTNRPGSMPGWVARRFEMPFVEVDPPSTVGSPLMVPGWNDAAVAASYATFSAFDAAFATRSSFAYFVNAERSARG